MRNALVVVALVACCGSLVAVAGESPAKVVYTCDFQKSELGKLPEDMMAIAPCEWAVRAEGENRFLVMPADPINEYAVLVGPEDAKICEITARIRASVSGRRTPEFGVGLGGAGGYVLWAVPAAGEIQLVKGEETVAQAKFAWSSDTWTQLRLRIEAAGEGQWRIVGKAWRQGQAEPADGMISFVETAKLPTGRASLWGTPYSEKEMAFDDIVVLGKE